MIYLDWQTVLNLNQVSLDTRNKLLLFHEHSSFILSDDIIVFIVILSVFLLIYDIFEVDEVLEVGSTVGRQSIVYELSNMPLIPVCELTNLVRDSLALDFSFEFHDNVADPLNAAHVVHWQFKYDHFIRLVGIFLKETFHWGSALRVKNALDLPLTFFENVTVDFGRRLMNLNNPFLEYRLIHTLDIFNSCYQFIFHAQVAAEGTTIQKTRWKIGWGVDWKRIFIDARLNLSGRIALKN